MKSNPAKVVVTHPVTGTKRQFDRGTYQLFKAAIIQSLKKSDGKTFTELVDDVRDIVRKKDPAFRGSIPWYTISVRLDLETNHFVETFTDRGKKLQRLVSAKPRPSK